MSWQVSGNRLYSPNDVTVSMQGSNHCALQQNVFYGEGNQTLKQEPGSQLTQSGNQTLPPPTLATEGYVGANYVIPYFTA